MKKKLTLVVTCIVLVAAMVIGGTLAYFTDKSEVKDNTFTVGNVKINLTETKWEGSGKEDAPEAYPGEALDKNPAVTNIGANPCFVRVRVTGLDSLGKDNMIKYRTTYVDDQLGANWMKADDGYFYYMKILGAKDNTEELATATSELFEQIVIPTTVTNAKSKDDNNKTIDYHVYVQAEAVQAQDAQSIVEDQEAYSWAHVKDLFQANEDATHNEKALGYLQAWFQACGMPKTAAEAAAAVNAGN